MENVLGLQKLIDTGFGTDIQVGFSGGSCVAGSCDGGGGPTPTEI